jgi:hypothetical protein
MEYQMKLVVHVEIFLAVLCGHIGLAQELKKDSGIFEEKKNEFWNVLVLQYHVIL